MTNSANELCHGMCEFCNLFVKLCNTLWLIHSYICNVIIQLQINTLLLCLF